MTAWKLYYGNMSVFSPEDGSWANAPSLDVAALAIPEPGVKRQIMTGDFYVLAPWNLTPHSPEFAGLLDYLHALGEPGLPLAHYSLDDLAALGVKVGRMYDNDVWHDLWEWIVADADKTWGDAP